MNIQEISRCSMFSSDYKNEELIYTTTDGFIYYKMDKLGHIDTGKCHIKFYPTDTLVFTTTGPSGLKVWETEKKQVIYSYNQEELKGHNYSNSCILAAFDDYNVKLYDLRTRYLINSFQCPNIKKLKWNADYIYCLTEEGLTILDYKTNGSILYSIPDVTDMCMVDESCYCLKKNIHELSELTIKPNRNENSNTITAGTTKKTVHYSSIQSVYDTTVLVGLMENEFKIEGYNKIESIRLNGITPIQIYLSENDGYLFTKDTLFRLNGKLHF